MFGWFKKKAKGAGPDLDPSTIVPRIKNLGFLESLRDRGIPEDKLPVTEPLVADLLITYAFDLPEAFVMVGKPAFERLGLSLGEMQALAMENLGRQVPRIGVQTLAPISRIQTGGDLEACILLNGVFWDAEADEAGVELVATAPSRNLILFGPSEDADAVASLRERTDAVYETETVHALSRQLLAWRGGRWVQFD